MQSYLRGVLGGLAALVILASQGCQYQNRVTREECKEAPSVILKLVDDYRTDHGLKKFILYPPLVTVAEGRSQHMADLDYYEQVGPDGKDAFDFVYDLNINFEAANSASIKTNHSNTGKESFEDLKKRASTNGYMLSSHTHIGAASAYDDDSGFCYITLLFAEDPVLN